MTDLLWKEISDLRERVLKSEMNHELLVRSLEQRLGAVERALGGSAGGDLGRPVKEA